MFFTMDDSNSPPIKTDWTDLSPDLLNLIAKNLPDISSFIRFRAVCKKWWSTVSISNHPPLLPWLLEDRTNSDSSTHHFYSFQHEKSHTLQTPKACNKNLIGPSRGFMLLLRRDQNSDLTNSFHPAILNPFTNVQIDLPFFENLWFIKPISLGSDPYRNEGEAVFYMQSLYSQNHIVAMWRPRANEWEKINVPRVKTITYCNGRLFTIDYGVHTTIVIDVDTHEIIAEIPPPSEFTKIDYLIEVFGELLGVEKLFNNYDRNLSLEDCRFEIYRLEEVNLESWRWEKLDGIGDIMLFLDKEEGFALQASKIDGARGNCVYFMTFVGTSKNLLVRYDVAERKTEVVPRQTDFPATWVIPAFDDLAFDNLPYGFYDFGF